MKYAVITFIGLLNSTVSYGAGVYGAQGLMKVMLAGVCGLLSVIPALWLIP